MKKKKHAAKYVPAALALTLMLCLGMCATALAAETGDGVTQAAITKNLQMDTVVTTPNAAFTFDVEKVSLDGNDSDTAKADMPTIGPQTVTFTSADTGTTAAGSRLKEVKKQTNNIIPDVSEFSHAGVYKYKVAENAHGYTTVEGTTMTYSHAEFTMEIYVKNKDDGSGLEIGSVYVNYVKDDEGNVKTGKVDPTPGTGTAVSAWQFVNKFSKTNTLTVSKTVAGDMGDKTKQFAFTLSLTTPSALEAADTTHTGTVARMAGSAAAGTTEVALTQGTPASFTLANGESLTITLPVGTTCTVGETADTAYTTTVAAKSNGAAITGNINPASVGVLTGENENSVAYTNTKTGTVPTGIIVDNLPFIILILAALCGFAGYIALKRRKYRS